MALISTGKYLKSDSLSEEGSIHKVLSCTEEQLKADDGQMERKWILNLSGLKPLILNATNTRRCVAAFGTAETDDWVGQEIIAYCDPTIEFGGKIIGGVRLRPVPKKQPAKAKVARVASGNIANGDDSIPF